MLLEVRGLSKKYNTVDGEVYALDNVSFAVKNGEFIAVVGRSGSGKSTLLNMLGALDKPDSGSVIFDGVDIVGLSDKGAAALRRGKIGIIYQFYNLIPELCAMENITLPTELDGREVDNAWLAEIMKIVGLVGREHSYPAALSGGQQQRVAIARALLSKPMLILADEPTGNLDSESADEVIELLKYMNREVGTTVIVVTHSDKVTAAAKRVIEISDGRISKERRL